MKMKRMICLALALILLLTLFSGCGKPDKNSIRVGSKDFTESLIVAEIYALALEDAGCSVERKLNIAGSMIHAAITGDDIDLYPEYTGTGLLSVLQLEMNSDPDVVYNTVKEEYEKRFSILFDGLRTMNTAKIVWGSLLSAVLAVGLDGALRLTEKRINRGQGAKR